MPSRASRAPALLALLTALACASCAEILGLEPPLGTGGSGGDAGTGGSGATTGQGGSTGTTTGDGGSTTTGQGGTGGTTTTSEGGAGGTTTTGQGGTGGTTCSPGTCASFGKNCGEIDDGCGTPLQCGTCPGNQICGYSAPNECGGTLRIRNGFVQSDGKKSISQTCDVLADGSVDCDETTHPFTTFTLPPNGITPDAGQFISDRFGSVIIVGSEQKWVSGFLQSDGAREWTQVCDIATGGVFQCDLASHPLSMVTLPPPGLTFDAGTHTGGRYTFVFWKDGQQKYRNGFIQSDGAKSFFQDCDVAADGDLDCDPVAHPFFSFTVPPAGFTLDAGTHVTDRFNFWFLHQGAQKLASGYVQSDGAKSFSQICDVSAQGMFDCSVAAHPYSTSSLPPPTVTLDAGTVTRHRYAFSYIQ